MPHPYPPRSGTSRAPLGSAVRIVCPDVGTNCLGRAQLLGELTARSGREVAIVGPLLGERDVWSPALSSHVAVRHHRVARRRDLLGAGRWLRRELDGTTVIVSKPLATSLGLTLAAGVRPSRMVLDTDDWELGMKTSHGPRGVKGRMRELRDPRALNTYFSTWVLDSMVQNFPHRLISNAWLEARFGGRVLPHVRDTEWLDPKRYDAMTAKRRIGLDPARFWVGFIGTPRRHKGLDELVEATRGAGDRVGLLLAGADTSDPYAAELLPRARAALGDRLVTMAPFPFSELPSVLAACDAAALPNRDDASAWGQVPAKLFDAMAMALPVVATDVGETGRILCGGDGWLVPPGDVEALAMALVELSSHREVAKSMGERARRRAVRDFSFERGADILDHVLRALPPPEGPS